jgi:hypothetical protein
MALFSNRQSTRDIAVAAAQTIQSHVEDCGRRWAAAEQTLRDLQTNLNEKHTENQKNRQSDRDAFSKFQTRLLVLAIVVLASILLKGTNFDILTRWLSGL